MTQPQSLGFQRSPDVLKHLVTIRSLRNKYRKIADQQIPQLIEFERLIPDIFNLDLPSGQENRATLIAALAAGDDDSIQLLIDSYQPYFDAQRQLETERMLQARKRASPNDLPRKLT